MTGVWNLQFWNGIGVVSLVLIIGFLFLLSLQRGWLVIGLYHREIIASKDSTITDLKERGAKDADSIATFSKAFTDKTATDDATARILSALRDTVALGDR